METGKKILAKLLDNKNHEVDKMIRQTMEERTLYGQEFSLDFLLTEMEFDLQYIQTIASFVEL